MSVKACNAADGVATQSDKNEWGAATGGSFSGKGNERGMQQESGRRKGEKHDPQHSQKGLPKAEDVRDPINKRRLAPKPRQLMSTTATIFFLFPSRTSRSFVAFVTDSQRQGGALEERMRNDLKQRCRLFFKSHPKDAIRSSRTRKATASFKRSPG
ncbi:hypothetical protein KCU65_g402, partial [Aureobasidium melanogenum]